MHTAMNQCLNDAKPKVRICYNNNVLIIIVLSSNNCIIIHHLHLFIILYHECLCWFFYISQQNVKLFSYIYQSTLKLQLICLFIYSYLHVIICKSEEIFIMYGLTSLLVLIN